jgi:hypothetical protein
LVPQYYYYYYYYLDKLTNRMSQLHVNQVKDQAKKKNDQTSKQSLRINRTIPTRTKQLASYCRYVHYIQAVFEVEAFLLTCDSMRCSTEF